MRAYTHRWGRNFYDVLGVAVEKSRLHQLLTLGGSNPLSDSIVRTPRRRRTIFLMPESDLPCLHLLGATPEILRGLMREISDDDARWKPASDRFSIAEVLAHLSHSDSHCYRMRLDRFLKEEKPFFESDDAQMHLDLYRDADPKEAFDRFEEQRRNNIEFLKNLPPGSGDGRRITRKSGRSRLPRCCMNGRYTTSDTSARSRSWCGLGNIGTAPGHSESPTN